MMGKKKTKQKEAPTPVCMTHVTETFSASVRKENSALDGYGLSYSDGEGIQITDNGLYGSRVYVEPEYVREFLKALQALLDYDTQRSDF